MKNLKNTLNLAFAAVFILSSVSLSIARDNGRRSSGPLRKTAGTPISTLVNVNNLAMWVRADGWSARNPATTGSGVLFPRGNPSGIIFADGLVWTGLVQDGETPELRAGGQTYAIGTVQGRIISKGVAEDPEAKDVRIWRVRRDFPKANLKQDAADFFDVAVSTISSADEEAIRNQYRKDWEEWPAEKGAPFYDSDGDGLYAPQFESDDFTPVLFPEADEPGIADGDQVVWFVANDLTDGAVRGLYGSPSMGLEMQATMWAYARTDALGFVIFKRFKLIYKGTSDTPEGATIDEMYISQWSDPDLGSFGDDYVGTDPATSMMYVYNSTAVDNAYREAGLPPPAAGYDFFAGPLVSEPCDAGTDPADCLDAGGTYIDEDSDGDYNPTVDTAVDTAIFDLKKRAGFRNLGASSMAFFASGTAISDPPLGTYEGTLQWRNLHFGLTPATGENFASFEECGLFTLCGDPVAGTSPLDTGPADRRMLMTTGPFTMALGDTQEVTVALLAAFGADNISAISVLRFYDISAQAAFDALFVLPKAPPSPTVSLAGIVPNPEDTRQEKVKIVINWGGDPDDVAATESSSNQGYDFEGYNVYQLPTASATLSDAKLLATFDVINEVTTILDPQFDETSGQILLLPSQLGTNSGIERFLTVEKDAITGDPLIMGRPYFFAVTAYNSNPSGEVAIHALESSLIINSVTPAGPEPGTRFVGAVGDTLKGDFHVTGGSDGSVVPIIVDPTKTTGNSYEVTFTDLDGVTTWSLTNSSTNTVLVADATNQSGDGEYAIAEGLQVKVLGPPPGMKDWDIPNGSRRFTWASADFGFEGFNGAIGWGSPNSVFGGGPPGVPAANILNVLLKLAPATDTGDLTTPVFDTNHENVSYAYRYGRNFSSPAQQPQFAPFIINTAGLGYDYQDFTKSVPLSAWDVEADPPRRLALGFLENNQPVDPDDGGGMVDGVWWPPASSGGNNVNGGGPREWLWIFNTDYSETPNPDYQVEPIGAPLPIMWWLAVARRGSEVSFEEGDEFLILANHVNGLADKFAFTSLAPTKTAEQAVDDISLINVFPNPYIGINTLETNAFDRFVRFTHLPKDAKIRIFNVAGVHVRTLEKDDPTTQFFDWDLLNKNRLPVASGIYIAYLDNMKTADGTDMGTKILKIAIVQERQFLTNF
ncbi:MAG: T9SS type A sorting domain-containing protein [Candidatus Marinimicrobia bacterium]|nr:T9SS type A sorting domain-containing protein [Candidatus Neomarinimicrobiota bacterium]